ncbi:MAG: hypothetical protein AAF441_08240 [Pseudomonadota bacterium]
MTVVRWIFAIFGILIMVFAGGCSILYSGFLLFVSLAGDGGRHAIGAFVLTLIFGGIPFLAGFLIWLFATKGRR